ncbi:ER membrane protein complex subunit 1-like [Dysidea avara]|uniref:ER membrane protein complex subunit 1-like n=1 Tax=Dysidea avara TaxID=196820 RepID=UPI00331911FD
MPRYLLLLYSCVLLNCALGLYEDEAGIFDWRQQYVGRVKHVYFDQSSQSGKRIIVATEDAALAVINTRTGGIMWRRVFEDPIDHLLHHKSVLISVSSGGTLLRSWDISSGYLLWEAAVLSSHDPSLQVDNGWGLGEVKVILARDAMIVLANGELTAVSVKNGNKLWNVSVDTKLIHRGVHLFRDEVLVFSVQGQSTLVLSKHSVDNGELGSTEELVAGSWLSEECLLLHSVLVCLDKLASQLRSVGLEEELAKFSSFSFESLQLGSDYHLRPLANNLEGRNEFLLIGTHSQYLINATQKSAGVVQEYPSGLLMAGTLDSELLTVVVQPKDKEMAVECWDITNNRKVDELSQQVELSAFRGSTVQGAIHLFLKTDDGLGYRAAIVWEDSSISLLHQTGRIIWSREEALTRINVLDFVGLPSVHYGSQAFPVMQQEKEQGGNTLTMVVQRFYGQLLQIQEMLGSFSRDGLSYWISDQDSDKMLGDQFGLRKIMVIVTSNGKLYGVDSIDGDVVWQSFLPEATTFHTTNKFLLFQLRSAVHYPLPPLAILLAQSKGGCDGTLLYGFNPLVGVSGEEPTCLPGHVIQTALLPVTDQDHTRVLLMLLDNKQVLVYPSSSHASLSNIFMFVVNKTSNDVIGYTTTTPQGTQHTGSLVRLLWSMHIPEEQEIIEVQSHHQSEHISSQAKVLDDGSVMYKYLNPNLVVMVTQSRDPSKNLLDVHLIDGVTGHVIFTAHHRQCSGPVHMIQSENWIIYHYQNVKLRRHELGVLELYQNSESENSTVWSSLDSPPKPLVFKQSFIFPSSITSLATSITSQGITHKAIIIGLPSGHLVSLPKMALDPMRTLEASDYSSGVPKYVPVLPVNSTFFVNYNQTVEKLSGIVMSPSGIESTSLLLAHGLDLFFTRVCPSKSFDVLADDFNYMLVTSVLIGMLCVAVVARKVSSRRALKAAWQ